MKKNRFKFPSNRLALDFLITVGARGAGRNIEKLLSPSDLAEWLQEAGIIDAPVSDLTERDLLLATELREAIYRSIGAAHARGSPAVPDIEVINEAASAAPPQLRLIENGRTIRREVSSSSDQEAAVAIACLSAVARDAIQLLGSELLEKVHTCDNPVCHAFFLDLSRPGKRRWCSMGEAGCGNRAKTAASRSRKRLETATPIPPESDEM